MDEVVNLIQESLPHLSSELLEKTKGKLIDIGVCNVDDMKLIQEHDLSDVLRPIQIRKLIQQCNAVKNPQTHQSPPFCKDNSSETSDTGRSESLFDSPTSSRCSTPNLPSDVDTTPASESSAKARSGPKHGNWIGNFEIPWNKFPKALLEACTGKVRPKPSDRREMVRIICDDIKQHCDFPGRKSLSKIAEMVVEKYKESFCDAVGHTIVGTGFESLRKQMEERLANLNRKGGKSGSLAMKLNAASDDDSEPKGKGPKKSICDSYGCINWQPDSLPENESLESQKEKQEWLTAEFPKKNVDKGKVALFMKETYASQRLLINTCKPNPPSIKEIKDHWPFLFEKDNMLLHFEQLMGFKLQVVLQKSIEEKASVIYDFMKQEHLHKKKVKELLLKIETTMLVENSKVPQMTGVYLLLLTYFGEPDDMMIKCFDETATVTDVLANNCPTTPFIAIFGDMLVAERCGLVIDQFMVNPSLNGIAEGVMILFASYFVLNIKYPNELAATLEFIQRCFVNLNPDKGNKRAKTKGKQHTVNPKVLSLANALKDYQNQWAL